MRTLSLAASAELARKLGAEPIILLQIEVPNNYIRVADKTIVRDSFTWQAKINTFSTIRTEKRADLVSSISTVQVTLDDSDETYRTRLKSERWLARKVKVFHSFEALNETFLVFAGKVSTPFDWKAEDRTLTFEVVSDFTSLQAGLEITEDDFPGAFAGAAPLAFGAIVNSCPTKIYENTNATVVTPFIRTNNLLAIPETAVLPYGTWAASPYQTQYGNYLYKSNGQYVVRSTTYSPSFDVDSSSKFPQNQTITLSVSNLVGKIKGSFNGNTFTVTEIVDILSTLTPADVGSQNEPDVRPSFIQVVDSNFDYTFTNLLFRTKNSFNEDAEVVIPVLSQVDDKVYLASDPPQVWTSIEVKVVAFTPVSYLFDPVKTVVVNAGAIVYLDDTGIIEAYAFSAMPYSNLTLLGYQIFNGKKNLRELPSAFYDIDTNFQGKGITAITIKKRFSAYKVDVPDRNFNLSWDDKFYVSFQSSVGSNVSDIIKFIIQTYTDLVIDAVSFASVKTLVEKYPANFVAKGAPDALQLISTICYESRCSINIKNGIVYLKYLSKEPDFVAEIQDAEVIEDTVELTYSDLSEVKTNLTGRFEVDCVDHVQRKVIFNHNVDIYGLIKVEKNYSIYNLDTLVKKSNTFWGNRISNQWKMIRLRTVLTSLAIEQGDCILVSSNLYTGKALVENIEYDSNTFEVIYELWTPVLVGTDTQSSLAWLSDTGDVKPPDPVIYSVPADEYSLVFPTSDYGVHSSDSLIGTITSNEDANGLASFTTSDGQTGVATNVNANAKVKSGDKAIIVKDKFNKFSTQAPGRIDIQQLQIISINGDTLICNPYINGAATVNEVVTVNRPYLLRTSLGSWNGLTFTYNDVQTRVASDGSTTQTQVIVPAYVIGDIIYAATGLNGASTQDLNADARAWAKKKA